MAIVPHKPLTYRQSSEDLDDHELHIAGRSHRMRPMDSCSSDPLAGMSSSTKSYDRVLFDVLRVSPEDFASQITLMDHKVFLRIQPEELSSCAWSTRQKLQTTPNIVAFTKRFNQVNFWVQTVVLGEETVAKRADVMSHFIKIAKQCYSLNNLHAVMAIISALQSASIFRLSRTWSSLSRKDRSTYDKLSELFSETNNREKLREYMGGVKLPVIPYLGLYLADLTYIDVAHPFSGGMETDTRKLKMNNILRLISEYQCSQYNLPSLDHIRSYLDSQHYIEELQKFIEDDNYKASLRLEPATSNSSLETGGTGSSEGPKSGDDLASGPAVGRTVSSGPAQCPGTHHGPPDSLSTSSSFVPKHRKSKSLGTSIQSADFEKTQSLPSSGAPRQLLIDDSLVCPEEPQPAYSATALPARVPIRPVVHKRPDLASQLLGCGIRSVERDPVLRLPNPTVPLWGGCVKRKTVLKQGKKPRISKWKRFWVQLWGSNLLYYAEKKAASSVPDGNHTRADFKADPSKMVSIQGWMVVLCGEPSQSDAFQLSSDAGNVYKMLAGSKSLAVEWVHRVSVATGLSESKAPENLITFHD